MGFLTEKVAGVRRDLDRKPIDESRLLARAGLLPPPRDFAGAAMSGTPAVIAEIKRASPSAGDIADIDLADQARTYEAGGAAAISVLTDAEDFGGSLADLRAVRLATTLPALRKDFLVHPAQLIEARAEGADAALLIAASLSDSELVAMQNACRDLGIAALVEVHAVGDLDRVLATEARLIGVNARDLETLDVDPDRALDVLRRVPGDRVAVLESGMSTREQVERAFEAGASAVLVGEALMRAPDPGEKLRELLGARQ